MRGVPSTQSQQRSSFPCVVGSTVLGPSATQSQLLLGAVWMGREDETREALTS